MAATRHFLITTAFWLICVAVGWLGSHFVAARWPSLGDVFGILGAVALFAPIASDMVWDILRRTTPRVFGPDGQPLPASGVYRPFSWKHALLNALGITLIGLGFGVNYLTKAS